MDSEKRENQKLCLKWAETSITLGILVVAIWGTCLLIDELQELRKQNATLEKSFEETIKPLGFIKQALDSTHIFVGIVKSNRIDKFSLEINPQLKNVGQGVLIYIGSLCYLSEDEIDFRKLFLNDKIRDVNFDKMYKSVRNKPLLYNDISEIHHRIEDIEFKDCYHLYFLFCYKDILGNLYDTIFYKRLFFTKPIVKDNELRLEFNKEKNMPFNQWFHRYTLEEKNKIISIFESMHKDFYDAILE